MGTGSPWKHLVMQIAQGYLSIQSSNAFPTEHFNTGVFKNAAAIPLTLELCYADLGVAPPAAAVSVSV